RSSTSDSSLRNPSSLRWADACRAEVSAACAWSSQNPGRPISASSRSTSSLSEAGSKVVRKQLQLTADLGEPRGDSLWVSCLGHGRWVLLGPCPRLSLVARFHYRLFQEEPLGEWTPHHHSPSIALAAENAFLWAAAPADDRRARARYASRGLAPRRGGAPDCDYRRAPPGGGGLGLADPGLRGRRRGPRRRGAGPRARRRRRFPVGSARR